MVKRKSGRRVKSRVPPSGVACFVNDRVDVAGLDEGLEAASLYDAYVEWARGGSMSIRSQSYFVRAMHAHGIESRLRGDARVFVGIRLRARHPGRLTLTLAGNARVGKTYLANEIEKLARSLGFRVLSRDTSITRQLFQAGQTNAETLVLARRDRRFFGGPNVA